MQRWKAAALASVLCSSVLSIWICREGLLLSHRLGPALAPLRRPPRTLDARIARLAQCKPHPGPGWPSRGSHRPWFFHAGGGRVKSPVPGRGGRVAAGNRGPSA